MNCHLFHSHLQHLQVTKKCALANILAEGHFVKELPPTDQLTCVIIDSMALIQSIGKPLNTTYYGDFANIHCSVVFKYFSQTSKRVDAVFGTYKKNSIKASTRLKRTKNAQKIRRISVLLPPNWCSLSLEEN